MVANREKFWLIGVVELFLSYSMFTWPVVGYFCVHFLILVPDENPPS